MTAIWAEHFPDVPMANSVYIRFVREGRRRLGWITMSESGASTLIGINRLLASPEVPQCLCDVTIAHELAHYAHGFGSPLERRYSDPHANGVVEAELRGRGLGLWLATADSWAEANWEGLAVARRVGRRRVVSAPEALVASEVPGL